MLLVLINFFLSTNTEEEDDNPYMVDFQQKYIDKALKHHEADTATQAEDVPHETNDIEDDDWYCIYVPLNFVSIS